jgi:hypothetical protein
LDDATRPGVAPLVKAILSHSQKKATTQKC